MHKLKPSHMPELVHDLSKWIRTCGPDLYPVMKSGGSIFHFPEGIRSFKGLANYHSQTLETAQLLFVGKDIAYLAAKTEMENFRLDASAFPSKTGVILWETPIGSAEAAGKLTAEYDPVTGRAENITQTVDLLGAYRNAPTPVNMVTWRLNKAETEVLICLHSDGGKARVGFSEFQRKLMAQGMTFPPEYADMRDRDPAPLEREQVLPLGETLGWITSYGSDRQDILHPTIGIDPHKLRVAKDAGVGQEMIDTHDAYMPTLNQMIKTVVATLMIRKMRMAETREVEATPSVKKKMTKRGATQSATDRRVSVVRIGRLKKSTAKKGGAGSPWSVKTVVGPVWRSRQYIPATGEYRENTEDQGWIEPYVAGPDDAPWSDTARVYLLD